MQFLWKKNKGEKMNEIAIFWDIENIAYDVAFEKINTFEASKKVFVHNEKYIPLKENKRNFLLNNGWEYFSVRNKKNAADDKLISLIQKEIENFDTFIIITQDYIFSSIICKLLELNKTVLLVTNGKEDKLMRRIEEKCLCFDKLTIL